ncbi:hypothetical protein CYLTODRAFT_396956 [Cylindrobasidium torrendii FP15055 ss-10]|uniref:DNA-directed RNA polymerase III subunit RPC9 n=1 Tax=Cylindrobasidium torrendii FP15055 ss-10 TaxID=1314674 RepID=A0A0D7BAC8_9AGAR|nr:hypothetical protein CYLTODRAFT_396956 [Cylindrobasidium torrendii FP15055 ss-10]
MEVVNARSALLSNYEVLSLLQELEADHLARTRTAVRIKKEEEAAGHTSTIIPGEKHPSNVEVIHNLRTVEVEAIQHLTAPHQSTVRQSAEGITGLTRALNQYELTKAEKLQIVNLAPTRLVELFVIVDDLAARFTDEKQEEILAAVEASLGAVPISVDPDAGEDDVAMDASNPSAWDSVDGMVNAADEFDDKGEGAGVEGDLDVDDD